jgi:hypothetical protein
MSNAPAERADCSSRRANPPLRGTVRFPIDLPVLSAIVWRFPGVVDVRVEATPREPNPQPTPPHSSDYDYVR